MRQINAIPEKSDKYLMEAVRSYREDEHPLMGLRWEGEEWRGEDLAGVEWKDCMICDCRLEQCDLSGWEMEDVRLENCDFVGCDFSSCRMRRVVFSGCRLTGCSFAQGTGRDMQFYDCVAQYADFTRGRWRDVEFYDCRLGGTSFADCRYTPTFSCCDLSQCNFFHTSMNNVDVTDSLLEGITVDIESLRGIIITPEQAAGLVGLFGIKVKR